MVAAIVILGTILVGIVLAKARHTRQLALAQQLQVAVRAADDLLAGWWISPQGVPPQARGQLDTQPAMVWETRVVANPPVQKLGARVVQLQVYLQPRVDDPVGIDTVEKPLVHVELVLPDPVFEAARLEAIQARQQARDELKRNPLERRTGASRE